ncbi:competence protein CoiA [Heyndrickxia sporothermodurans]
MLTALTEEGKMVHLIYSKNIKYLSILRKNHSFYCPQCQEEVILKIGKIKIPHFSHKSNSICTNSEPESEVHLQGKIDLYKWLKHNGISVEMEKYLMEIRQRPDLFVQKNGKKYAIEFQCSPIQYKDIKRRTLGYFSLNIIPIWILGGEPFQKKFQLINNLFQLSDFQWAFTQYNRQNGMHIYSYSPKTKRVILLSQLTPVTTRKIFAYQSVYPLASLDFPFHFTNDHLSIVDYDFWFYEKKNWIQNKMLFAKNLNDPFLSEVYHNKHSPILLPPFIGIPVPFMSICKTNSVIWQYYLWLDGIETLSVGDKINLMNLKRNFERRVKNGCIKMRDMSLIQIDFKNHMIYHYLKRLSILGIIKEQEKGSFIMNKSYSFPNNIEEVQRMEVELKKKLDIKP